MNLGLLKEPGGRILSGGSSADIWRLCHRYLQNYIFKDEENELILRQGSTSNRPQVERSHAGTLGKYPSYKNAEVPTEINSIV